MRKSVVQTLMLVVYLEAKLYTKMREGAEHTKKFWLNIISYTGYLNFIDSRAESGVGCVWGV